MRRKACSSGDVLEGRYRLVRIDKAHPLDNLGRSSMHRSSVIKLTVVLSASLASIVVPGGRGLGLTSVDDMCVDRSSFEQSVANNWVQGYGGDIR